MRQSLPILLGIFLATLVSAQTVPIRDDDDAAARAASITALYHLTGIKTECLYFDTYDEGRSYLVRVREKHSKECGGDADTSQTVFFMRLRKSDGHVTTTAYNLDGNFEKLKSIPANASGSGH